MHEILANLPPGALVLDIGSSSGSFDATVTAAKTIRLDRDPIEKTAGASAVRADAALLPFADSSFRAVVSNHSLEHFDNLEQAIQEIGRVLAPDGALYVSVPDASTLTDRIYRWLSQGGGHVNAFVSPVELAGKIESVTGLKHQATRTLCSSMSFLNHRNASRPRPRRLILLGGGAEWSLRIYTWISRRFDLLFRTRTSIYGWAIYFGSIHEPVTCSTSFNVCIRCGSATPAATLQAIAAIHSAWHLFRCFNCPNCGAANPYIADPAPNATSPPPPAGKSAHEPPPSAQSASHTPRQS